jgi:hypothetical protein
MRFASVEALSAWFRDYLDERMAMNAAAMRADGISQDEVDAVMKFWRADVERSHQKFIATVERIRSAPDAPSHNIQ